MGAEVDLTLETPRLLLVAATPPLIAEELHGNERLGDALGAVVPDDWPPEYHDSDTLRFWEFELSKPGAAGWWLYYVLLKDRVPRILVGTAAYKGPPADGVVEIGYSIVPTWQRRGFATEAARRLIDRAWEHRAQVIVAHTLEQLKPSIAVLEKLGFDRSDPPEPGLLAFALRRAG